MTRLVRFVAIMAAVATLTACDKSDDPSLNLNGRYMGTFSRTGMDTASVSILFTDNTIFSGQSDRINYPAICHGSFDLNDNLIRFNDSCAWTANFDWSLILSGQYNISNNNGTMRIWKTNGTVTDEYLLRQVVR
jgi:hypothetical protein